mmetsp:Transcript_29723/g.78925  ORF Transcript_29723/g.78925 Transcript_29723/m.78925 type:complete len:218 (+) Transcript_29723:2685-3338(+)
MCRVISSLLASTRIRKTGFAVSSTAALVRATASLSASTTARISTESPIRASRSFRMACCTSCRKASINTEAGCEHSFVSRSCTCAFRSIKLCFLAALFTRAANSFFVAAVGVVRSDSFDGARLVVDEATSTHSSRQKVMVISSLTSTLFLHSSRRWATSLWYLLLVSSGNAVHIPVTLFTASGPGAKSAGAGARGVRCFASAGDLCPRVTGVGGVCE